MVKVKWTNSAIEDLNDIGEFIAKDSIKYAEITVNHLFEAVDILEKHPYSGIIVPEFDNDLIRQIIRGNYRIVYKVIDDYGIDILTAHNCARLISNSKPFTKNE